MRFLLAAPILLALLAAQAAACLCDKQTFCERLYGAEVVFVGETIRTDDDGTLLRVVERFRDVPEGLEQIEIETFFGGACRSPYAPGEQTLVILEVDADGKLSDGPCSRSIPVTGHSAEVLLVRRIGSEGLVTLLYGTVATPSDNSGWDTPIEGAIVEAELGGQTYSTTADAQGRYELTNIPAGDYRIRPQAFGYRNIRGATGAEIPSAGCVKQDLALTATNTLSGVVFDAAKQPAEGLPIALHHQHIQPEKPAKETTTDSAGRFRFSAVAPGSYRVALNPQGPTPAMPYDRVEGEVLYIGPAARLTGQNIRLGRRLPTRTIEISMSWTDGSPANGHVSCRDLVANRLETTVGVEGVARCPALADHAYEVRVTATPHLNVNQAEPWIEEVPAGPDDATLNAVLGPP